MWPVSLVRVGGEVACAAATVGDALERESFRVEVVAGASALPAAPATPLVLAFVDAGVDGAVLERLVRWRARAPFACGLIGCAPAGGVADSERALAAGFDDFVAGRLSVRELAGRLRAVGRRLARGAVVSGRLGVGRLTLDVDGHDLWVGERRVRLTRLESRTLAALMRAPGYTLSRAELLERVWGDAAETSSETSVTSVRVVDNVVQRLRRKVAGEGGSDVEASTIVTVRGMGFRLAVDGGG